MADKGNMRILAFDPGGTTGIAYWETWEAWENVLYNLDRGPTIWHVGPDKHHDLIWDYLQYYNPTHVVYESFEFRNKSRDNLELISREYIGVIELYATQVLCNLYKQSASQAKGFIPDTGPKANQALKQLGWYNPGKKHAMDAVRHLVYFLVNGPHCRPNIRQAILEKGFK